MKLFKKITVFCLAAMMTVGLCVGCQKPVDLAGVTDTHIYVGNTAGTTGALSTIGGPFNLGIEAAFYAYNQAGGYKGLNEAGEALETGLLVELKHYDDGGDAAQSKTLTEKLIHEDEVFAIVGNFAATCVETNLASIKEAEVPMVYAAAGNDILHNDNATSLADRGIFPVQPLNKTEGRMLILRAFAPAANGGLAATKVGVLSDAANEASKTMLKGINDEANANLSATQKSNIVTQEVSGSDYAAAVNALKNANCDVIIITSTGANYLAALKAIASAEYTVKVLTSYNNASAAPFNDATTNTLKAEYADVFNYVTLYAQAWLDITSATELYTNTEHPLYALYNATFTATFTTTFTALYYQTYYDAYIALEYTPEDAAAAANADIAALVATTLAGGMPGFKLEYWELAEDIYDYCIAEGMDALTAFTYSYDSYAIAGYIAGDLFCQGLAALEESGKALTRENYIDVMGAGAFSIPTANDISFVNGLRQGVDSFALTSIYNNGTAATSATAYTLVSLDEYRTLLAA
ncbi:MAG: ABC transporter substrate-binding protein [Clostridia bacterium]|nr:ABC transporter substrate-binding protein [Clostridia bacterium]